LRLPPLRERLEDIPDLVRHFQARAIKEGLPSKEFDADALQELTEHRWPGNIRELENIVKRLLAMEVDDSVSATAVRRELAGFKSAEHPSYAETSAQSLGEFLDGHLARYFASFGQSLPPEGIYERYLAEMEAPLLRATLTATRGNQIKAAEVLGINRNTLRTKLKDRRVQVIRGLG
jgi:two-component system, NtrC family, nitrogen regulation response regulator GlnG